MSDRRVFGLSMSDDRRQAVLADLSGVSLEARPALLALLRECWVVPMQAVQR
jgi:hypothetical protein